MRKIIFLVLLVAFCWFCIYAFDVVSTRHVENSKFSNKSLMKENEILRSAYRSSIQFVPKEKTREYYQEIFKQYTSEDVSRVCSLLSCNEISLSMTEAEKNGKGAELTIKFAEEKGE